MVELGHGEGGRQMSLLEGNWALYSGSIIKDIPDYEQFRRIKGRGSNASGGDYCSITRFFRQPELSSFVTCVLCFGSTGRVESHGKLLYLADVPILLIPETPTASK